MTLFETLYTLAEKRARYARTTREIRNMSNAMARDLDINPANARTIAHHAIYGA